MFKPKHHGIIMDSEFFVWKESPSFNVKESRIHIQCLRPVISSYCIVNLVCKPLCKQHLNLHNKICDCVKSCVCYI